jgi:uncharacterized membrane protein
MERVVGSSRVGMVCRLLSGRIMSRLFDAGADWLVIWIAVMAAAVAVAIYVIGKVRGKAIQQEPGPSELMSKFRELHSQGELTDAEFRTIKTTLAAQLQEELRDNGETGYDE